MTMAAPLPRPELTMPPAEADWLRAAYAGAEVILEYGSGGSTAMAAEMPGKTVYAVENDAEWAGRMLDWFDAHPPAADVTVHHVDTGRTRGWGLPKGHRGFGSYARYPLEIWEFDGFRQPDVVLVDGRFRLGCVLATAFMTRAPVALYFDDYVGRRRYHRIERLFPVAETRGRMARFDITPTAIPQRDLRRIIEWMTDPA